MECKFCKGKCQKAGRQKNGVQKLYCKACGKYQQSNYKYLAYKTSTTDMIPILVCESVSIRGIGRILRIGLATVIKRIKAFADSIQKPPVPVGKKEFEMDEVRTYIRNKENQYWIAYAINRESKKVIDFIVGKRSKRTLRIIVNTLLLSEVQKIKTDKLNIYQALIPAHRHVSNAYNINHIERNNLNLRTHLKRLSRRTICFSRCKFLRY